ncbi:MAG: hypothetical protein P8184_04720 [Calditrichia bacterium]
MKKWAFVLFVIAGIIGLIILVEMKIINWQPLTIIIAALAAPVKYVLGLFEDKEEAIKKRHEALREMESVYEEDLHKKIREQEDKTTRIGREIQILEEQLEILRRKRELIDSEVEGMTLEDLRKKGKETLGS